MESRITERVFRRLLRESVGSDLAALTRRRPGNCLAVLYDPELLKSAFGEVEHESLPMTDIVASGAVKAYVRIVPPSVDCNGAWMVGEMWGRGYGEILVDIAFALSPGGAPLIMDRQIASPGAKSRWKIATQNLKGTPLPPDCTTHHNAPGEEYLNASYNSPGNPGMLGKMEKLHVDTMDDISGIANLPPKVIENALIDIAYENFDISISVKERNFDEVLNKYVKDSRTINSADRKFLAEKISKMRLRPGLTLERVSSTMPGEVGDKIDYDLVSFTKVSLSSGKNAGHIGWKYSDVCMMRIDNPTTGYEIDYGKITTLFDASDEREVILTGKFSIVDKVEVTEPGTAPQYGYKVPMFILKQLLYNQVKP